MATMCQNHPDVKATFVGTVLEPDVVNVAVCDECMPLFCAAVFEEMTGVDMSPALYLASEEGQANPDGPPQAQSPNGQVEEEPPGLSDIDPTAAASGPSAEHTVAEGAPSDEPPAPAPADADEEAADPTGAAAAGLGASADTTGSAEPASVSATASGPPEGGSGDQAADV